MKILIAIPQSTILPSGPAYVASSLSAAGFDVEGYFFKDVDDYVGRLAMGRYDVVMTGGLCSHFHTLKTVVHEARRHGAITVLGGGIVTSEPELIHRALGPDYSVLGQGEATAVELATRLENKSNPDDILGIAYVGDDGQFTRTGPRPEIADLDSLPFPDYDLFGLRERLDAARPSDEDRFNVFDNPREYPVIGSRGCPYSCSFCYHTSNRHYRCRSIPNIMAEVTKVVTEYGVNILFFLDELFTANETRLREFCQAMIEFRRTAPHEVVWQAAVRVDKLKPQMLDMMKAAGCYIASYGFESHSQSVLNSMHKHITTEQIDNAVRWTLDRKMAVQANFILGDRAETVETASETLRYRAEHPELGIQVGAIMVVPNSLDYQYCVSKGIIRDRLDHIANHWSDWINYSQMTHKEHDRMLTEIYLLNLRRVYRAVVRHSSADSVEYSCPHCLTDQTMRRYALPRFGRHRVICRNCGGRLLLSGWLRMLFERMVVLVTPRAAWPYRLLKLLRKVKPATRIAGSVAIAAQRAVTGLWTGLKAVPASEASTVPEPSLSPSHPSDVVAP
jgi:radical SAM superfamily enzyme YgiQ (UPF0313 family)